MISTFPCRKVNVNFYGVISRAYGNFTAEFDANPISLAAAREVRSSATVAIESPQSEIRRMLPRLIARNHRYDFPPEIRSCLQIRREETREVTIRRDAFGR